MLGLCVSCTTLSSTDKDDLASSSISLANKYCSNGQYSEAIRVYDLAYFRSKDYRYLYNKALILQLTGAEDDAASVCMEGWKQYAEPQFLLLRADILNKTQNFIGLEENYRLLWESSKDNETYIKNYYDTLALSDENKAYSFVLSLWNEGKHNLFIVSLLMKTEPEQWRITYLALGGKEDEQN